MHVDVYFQVIGPAIERGTFVEEDRDAIALLNERREL